MTQEQQPDPYPCAFGKHQADGSIKWLHSTACEPIAAEIRMSELTKSVAQANEAIAEIARIQRLHDPMLAGLIGLVLLVVWFRKS